MNGANKDEKIFQICIWALCLDRVNLLKNCVFMFMFMSKFHVPSPSFFFKEKINLCVNSRCLLHLIYRLSFFIKLGLRLISMYTSVDLICLFPLDQVWLNVWSICSLEILEQAWRRRVGLVPGALPVVLARSHRCPSSRYSFLDTRPPPSWTKRSNINIRVVCPNFRHPALTS